jgi:biopolymer transport protein ExbD
MKLNSSKKGHYESGPNMTPLVDVVMVILIFLMKPQAADSLRARRLKDPFG